MYDIKITFFGNEKIFSYQVFLDEDQIKKLRKTKKVLIENDKFLEVGNIADLQKIGKNKESSKKEDDPVGNFLRVCDENDLLKINELKLKAKEYIPKCIQKVKIHNLNMKIFDADLSFDEKKLTIYFGATSRIDFRKLVLDFIKDFKKMIRLQQIATRDQAKIVGGYGACGRELCCKKFLNSPDLITLDCAKIQDLSNNVGKISGCCGKLMCCLNYELEEYKRLKDKFPKIGSKLKTSSGLAYVIGHNIFNESVMVEIVKDKRRIEVKL